MKVGCAPADRIETIGVHEFPERIPICKQVPESLQECFSSGIPTAAWYLVFRNECVIYQFHKHYNFGFACFLGEAFFVLTFFFSLLREDSGLLCSFTAAWTCIISFETPTDWIVR